MFFREILGEKIVRYSLEFVVILLFAALASDNDDGDDDGGDDDDDDDDGGDDDDDGDDDVITHIITKKILFWGKRGGPTLFWVKNTQNFGLKIQKRIVKTVLSY